MNNKTNKKSCKGEINMKAISILLLTIVMTILCSCSDNKTTEPIPVVSINVINNSSEEITSVNIRFSGSYTWGAPQNWSNNLLTSPIRPGASRTIAVNNTAGVFDIMTNHRVISNVTLVLGVNRLEF